MCYTQLAENTGRKNWPSAYHRTTLLGYIFATKACVDSRKNLLNSNISSTFPDSVVNFGPLTTETGWQVWVTPANFNGFHVLALLLQRLLQRCRSPEANQTLHDIWPSPALLQSLYICGGCCPLAEFCQVQNSLCVPSLAFSYISSVTARHSSSRHQPKFAAWYKEWNYRTFAEGATYIRLGGHNVGHRPTF